MADQVAEINSRRREVEARDFRKNRIGVHRADGGVHVDAGDPVQADNLEGRFIHEGMAENREDHAALAIELTDDRDHCFSVGLLLGPILELLLGFFGDVVGQSSPHSSRTL